MQESTLQYQAKFFLFGRDAQEIGMPDEKFDVVLANYMLYHLDDRQKAFHGIRRVLKDGGIFLATTMGKDNDGEMNQLLYEYLASKGRYFRFKESAFSLENGEGQLKQVFEDVAIEVFHDRLEVDDAEAIVAYHQSFNDMHEGFMVLPDEEADGFRKYLKSILQEKQTIGVAKISGIFVCQK